jgi:murein DD-endopeptidase MepM/ murein hydrolase activator NlpD
VIRLLLVLLLLAAPAAAEVELKGQAVQGGLLFGRAAPGAEVRLDGRAVRVAEDGRFVIGFGREAAARALLEIFTAAGIEQRELSIAPRQWDIQRIDGLPEAQVTPPPQVLARIRKENDAIAEARRRDTAERWFEQGFAWPAQGRVSGVYGSQRILNGQPRQPHFGLDIAAPVGTPVVASTSGEVILADRDLYYTGGTIILDHGFGLTAVYSHLSRLDVRVGQRVKQGEVIGAVGATGRATGAHLDWRLNWFDVRLDPQLLLPPAP